MKRFCFQFGAAGSLLLLLVAATGTAAAQARNSGPQTITLTALVGEGITVGVSTNTVNFNLISGSATNLGTPGVTVTMAWNAHPGRDIHLYAFFSNSAAALSGSGINIPSARFSISDNGGAYLALTNNTPFGGAGAGLQIGPTTKVTGQSRRGTRQDNLLFNLDISALSLPPGTYTGVLTLRAQVI